MKLVAMETHIHKTAQDVISCVECGTTAVYGKEVRLSRRLLSAANVVVEEAGFVDLFLRFEECRGYVYQTGTIRHIYVYCFGLNFVLSNGCLCEKVFTKATSNFCTRHGYLLSAVLHISINSTAHLFLQMFEIVSSVYSFCFMAL